VVNAMTGIVEFAGDVVDIYVEVMKAIHAALTVCFEDE
jgi:hypothetical protein